MAVSGAVLTGCHSNQTFETPGEMRLISEARCVCHLENRITGCQSVLGGTQATLQMVGMGRHTEETREGAREPIGIQICTGGKLRQGDGSIIMRPEKFHGTRHGGRFSADAHLLRSGRSMARKERLQRVKQAAFALEGVRGAGECQMNGTQLSAKISIVDYDGGAKSPLCTLPPC